MSDNSDIPPPYIARISHKMSQYADDIILKEYSCEKHTTIQSFRLINLYFSKTAMSDDDFQAVDRVTVNNKEYFYSQKVQPLIGHI